MATILIEGFEWGDYSANGANDPWTGGAGVISYTPARTGNYAFTASTSSEYATVALSVHGNGVSTTTTFTAVFYIRISTSLSARGNIFSLYNGTNHCGVAVEGTTAYIYAGTGTTSNALSFGSSLSTSGTWHRIDFKCDASTGTWSYTATMDGAGSATQTASLTSTAFDTFYVGNYEANAIAADLTIDDLIVTNSTADYPIGASKVVPIQLTSDGSHNTGSGTWTDSSSGAINDATTTVYTWLDGNGTFPTTHVRQTTNDTASYVECLFENPTITGFDVLDLYAMTWVQNSSPVGSTPQRAYAYDTNGAAAITPDVVPSSLDPSATVTCRKAFLTAPGGGWTSTVLDGLAWRCGHGDGAPDNYHFPVLIQIALTEQAAEGYTHIGWGVPIKST